jgi:NAD(P)-dependent dehydrogenase (short-subunit alcohol dehydrogenase family)
MQDTKEPIKSIIVGATGGIGLAVCKLLAESGGEAFLIGRSSDKLKALSDQYGWGYAVADGSDWSQLDAVVSSAEGLLGGINAAINLAGSVLLKPIHLSSKVEWDATVAANLTSAAGLMRVAIPRLMASGGSIVLMSSAAASIGLANHEAIAACKAGIEGMVRSAAATYAAKKIRVNAVAPGLVQTPLTERIWSNVRSAEMSLSLHPLGRFGTPDDIARAILWLASPDQSWVTGQTIGVDGGLGTLKTIQSTAPSAMK